jgi:hypothetical protein
VPTLTEAFELWNESIADVANIAGMTWTLTQQPINNAVLSKQTSNSLGLPKSAPTGSFMVVELAATWTSASDTTFVTNAANCLMGSITGAAKSRGTLNRWIDMNHASNGQDPISGYGPAVKAKLLAVSKKYDPSGVFQTKVPGGFKLN